MPLETGSFISDLVVTNPLSSDGKDKGDDHLRLLKLTIKTTFPNVTGAVTPTHTELNFVDGVTSAIQTQLNTLTTDKGAITGQTWTGTHTFPATTYGVTATAGDSSIKLATTAFVAGVAFSAILPAQAGNAGRVISTDGGTASWTNYFIFNDPMYWMGI
jgi:energy-converting hydrogenase Eha subunit A